MAGIAEWIGAWKRRVGYVTQAPYLLDDSLRRNMALGIRDTIDEQRILDAGCRATRPWSRLSLGLETKLGDRGIRLSGGERQSVAIARALYRDPAVLVLDEATAALDLETEREVTRAIEALQGRGPSSSSRIGCPPSDAAIASSCSARGESPPSAPMPNCSPRTRTSSGLSEQMAQADCQVASSACATISRKLDMNRSTEKARARNSNISRTACCPAGSRMIFVMDATASPTVS